MCASALNGRDPCTARLTAKNRSNSSVNLIIASIAELKERWRTFYGNEPHRRMSRELLTRAVAYAQQEQLSCVRQVQQKDLGMWAQVKPRARSGALGESSARRPQRLRQLAAS
jgi:hypothetical protein